MMNKSFFFFLIFCGGLLVLAVFLRQHTSDEGDISGAAGGNKSGQQTEAATSGEQDSSSVLLGADPKSLSFLECAHDKSENQCYTQCYLGTTPKSLDLDKYVEELRTLLIKHNNDSKEGKPTYLFWIRREHYLTAYEVEQLQPSIDLHRKKTLPSLQEILSDLMKESQKETKFKQTKALMHSLSVYKELLAATEEVRRTINSMTEFKRSLTRGLPRPLLRTGIRILETMLGHNQFIQQKVTQLLSESKDPKRTKYQKALEDNRTRIQSSLKELKLQVKTTNRFTQPKYSVADLSDAISQDAFVWFERVDDVSEAMLDNLDENNHFNLLRISINIQGSNKVKRSEHLWKITAELLEEFTPVYGKVHSPTLPREDSIIFTIYRNEWGLEPTSEALQLKNSQFTKVCDFLNQKLSAPNKKETLWNDALGSNLPPLQFQCTESSATKGPKRILATVAPYSYGYSFGDQACRYFSNAVSGNQTHKQRKWIEDGGPTPHNWHFRDIITRSETSCNYYTDRGGCKPCIEGRGKGVIRGRIGDQYQCRWNVSTSTCHRFPRRLWSRGEPDPDFIMPGGTCPEEEESE